MRFEKRSIEDIGPTARVTCHASVEEIESVVRYLRGSVQMLSSRLEITKEALSACERALEEHE